MNNTETDKNISEQNNKTAGVPKKNGSGGGMRKNQGRGGCANPRQSGKSKNR